VNPLGEHRLQGSRIGTIIASSSMERTVDLEIGAWANIPPKSNRNDPICFSPYLYRARNKVERFFNRIKQCRRVATRYDKLAANYLALRTACIDPALAGRALMSPRPNV
jgi:transposase